MSSLLTVQAWDRRIWGFPLVFSLFSDSCRVLFGTSVEINKSTPVNLLGFQVSLEINT